MGCDSLRAATVLRNLIVGDRDDPERLAVSGQRVQSVELVEWRALSIAADDFVSIFKE